jgi:hypothetical protein
MYYSSSQMGKANTEPWAWAVAEMFCLPAHLHQDHQCEFSNTGPARLDQALQLSVLGAGFLKFWIFFFFFFEQRQYQQEQEATWVRTLKDPGYRGLKEGGAAAQVTPYFGWQTR